MNGRCITLVGALRKQSLPIIVIVVAIALPLAIQNPYYLHILIIALMWAYLASAWNIIGGFGGQLSLGHGVYTAIGAYGTVLLFNQIHLTPWLGMWFAAAVAVLVSVLIGYPTFSLRGAYYALATVAFSEGVMVVIENTTTVGNWHIGGAEGLLVPLMGNAPVYFQFTSKVPYYYIVLIMVLAVISASRWVQNSRLGYYLTALREDEDAAKALGVDVRRAKLIAGALSAALTALGGSFYAQLIRYLEPKAIAGPAMSTQMVFLAIVGGRGTVLGPIVGGVALSLLGELIRSQLGGQIMGLHLFLYGVIVVLTVVFRPDGLIGTLEQMYNRLFSAGVRKEVGYGG